MAGEDATTMDSPGPGTDAVVPEGDAGATNPEAGGSADGSTCAPVVESHPIEGFQHLTPICTATSYATNPPSSGNHYGYWANFATFTFPLPAGFFVHDLEHGAVVFTYNCPDGCAEDVAKLQAMVDALPADPACAGFTAARRSVITPYPALTVRFGASSWGSTLRSDCFDETAFRSFYLAHFGQGREPYCNDGVDVLPTTCP